MKIDRRYSAAVVMAFTGLLGFQPAAVADDFSGWLYHSDVTLTAPTGVTGNVAGFPVLIRLTSSTFSPSIFSQAKSDGSDIRFSKSDGTTPLPYQIERWDNANSLAEIWVKVDVNGTSTNGGVTTFKMYWDSASATSQSNGAAVFSTSNGFVGVWHLNEGGTGTRYNSAQGSYNGTPQNYTGTESVNGMMAKGDSLGIATTNGDGIQIPNIPMTGMPITLSAWVKLHTTIVNQNGAGANGWNNYGKIISQQYGVTSVNPWHTFSLEMNGNQLGYLTGPHVQIGIASNTTTWIAAVSSSTLTADAWSYVTGTLSQGTNGQLQMYFNGNPDSTPTTVTGAISNPNSQVTTIGYNAQNIERFNGVIDEARIENQARSVDWIKLCYATQNPSASCLSFSSVASAPPVITTQPTSQTVNSGSNVTFFIVATGGGLSYQWERSNNGGDSWANVSGGSGGTTANYSFTTNSSDNNAQFRCRVSNTLGNDTSNAAILTICAAPTITTQPVTQTIPAGQDITFTVVASGTGLSYQWQDSVPGGAPWGNVSGNGANTSSYTFTTALVGDGVLYRCVINGMCGSITSSSAICHVCQPPAFSINPQSQNDTAGQTATFTVSVSGPVVSLQWERNNGGGWSDISGAAGTSYSLATIQNDNGAQFRCRAFNTCDTVWSSVATLSVCTPVSITAHSADTNVTAGQDATFSVVASGSGTLAYQWLYSVDAGAHWGNVSGGTGANTALYRFTTASSDNGHQYRCEVFNGCAIPDSSHAVTLTVCTPPSISSQPADPGPKIAGESVSLSVTVPGTVTSPAFQWERNNGSGWTNATGGSATSATYIFTTLGSDNGVAFRCRVTACAITVYSSAVTLSVCTPASITAQPKDSNVTEGQPLSFSVAAAGSPTMLYQWQNRVNSGSTWSDILAAVSATYGFTAASSQNGYQYRCIVSNGCGSAAVSAAATLSVCTPPSIVSQPSDWSGNAGSTAAFTISIPANVTSPVYQWERNNGSGWTNATGGSATLAAYTFTASGSDNGAQFRCRVSGSCGSAVYSNVVNCTVCSQAVITANPANRSDTAGRTATFTVGATGTPSLSYQWQVSTNGGSAWSDIPGAVTASYSFTTATANNGWQFRCVVFTACFTPAVSAAAVLSVCTPPVITQQPVSQPGKQIGEAASFSLAVAAEVTSPSFNWQRSDNNGTTWNDISGATNALYSFTVAAGDAAALFRCNVTNPCGQLNSVVVSIGVCTAASLSTQPANQDVTAGQSAAFSVVAGGNPAPSYQWQRSIGVWTDIGGATSAIYSFTAIAGDNGAQFRCVVSNGCGSPATSSAATLSVCTPPQVVSEPGNQDMNLGDTAQFGITATGSSLTYQWQKSTDGATWNTVIGGTGATSAAYRLVSVASDNNARFRCIIVNGCGKDTSAFAFLYVCSPPVIVAQPRDTGVVSGASASFSVVFSGTNPLYQWQRSPDGQTWADISNQTAATYTITAAPADNGAQFHCVIRSKCGNIITSAATLRVCDPVTLSAQTVSNQTVLADDPIAFGVTATGTNPSYVWQKKAFGDSLFRAIVNATAASYSFTAQTADSAGLFRCVAVAACGAPETSQTALVIVYAPLAAAFSAPDSFGQAPLTVTFTDLSTGSFTQRIWDFGDGTAPDSASKNPSHTYASAGAYTVRLTVSGPAPRNTSVTQKQIFTWNPGGNPIWISGMYLAPQKVAITLTNYGTITPPSSYVSADSVGLWYKKNVAPLAIDASATFIKGYTLAQLRSRGTSYTDTLNVPALAPPDSAYGFANVVVWTDRTTTVIAAGNTASVLMKDTLPINNVLILSGVYLQDDTAKINLDNVSKLDTSRVDSVAVWYSLSTDTVNFSDTNSTRRLSMQQVAAAGNRYSVFIVNPQFNNEKKTMWAAVELVGKNKRISNVQVTFFVVGKDRPLNPVRLHAKALSATRIRLSWNKVASTGIEQMVIWYRTTAPVPLAIDVAPLKMASLNPAVSDTVIISNKFSDKTRYFFGAQVYQNGLWSLITDSASATDSTPEAGDSLPYNSAQIKSLVFDTSVNQIKVGWSVNPAQAESLQLGILYSTDAMPKTSTGQQQVIDVTAAQDSVYLAVQGSILFDKTYYVSLWVRRSGGKWTAPTPLGMDSVRVPPFTWQNVVYFSKENDTVFAFNNKVWLLNSPGDLSSTHNTVVYFAPAPAVMPGLFPASIGFTFKKTVGGFPFYVGLKVDSVPAGYTFGDVRIYHLTSAGLWVLDNHPFSADSASRYVSVLTNQLDLPFMAMVDTMKPVVTGPGNVGDPVVADLSISDTVIIHDNIANVTWRYKTAKGGASFTSGDISQGGMLSDTTDTIAVTIPGEFVNQDNGVRAFFIVSDGIHIDTLVLSRSVIRDNCGIVRTVELKWTPLPVSMVLDSVEAKQRLKTVAGGTTWKYDTYKFRLFRWYPDSANAGSKDKWVEYSDTIGQAFAFTRGSLLWIKTREKADVNYGRGVTPSLVHPYAMRLGPATWGDFALPFKFDIKLGDILNATRAAGANPDTLQFYQWKKDAAGRYWSEPIFIKGIDSLNRQDTVLSSTDVAGFSVYNPSPDTMRLVIPPVAQAMSTFVLPKKAANAGTGWALVVKASLSDGTRLSPVYCGYSKGGRAVTYYPQPLSFVKAYTGVFDVAAKKVAGHAMAHAQIDGGNAYLLAFVNESQQKEVLQYSVENQNSLPKGIKSGVYDALTGQFENPAGAGMSVPVEPGAKEYRWLLVGTDAYLAKAALIAKAGRLLLAGTYPNPFRSMVRIRYSLPYEGVDRVKFTIYNLLGRTIWRHEVGDCSGYGAQDLVWNARADNGQPVATGVYIIRMVALSKVGKQVGMFERRMIMVK
jgi:PKD repeat protein